tara:strand:- start:28968 stop:29240 length:273 start_codon:yes stop_codon:yes gene_type:complete
MKEICPRVRPMTQRKSESARLNLRVKHNQAPALAASLTTEASFDLTGDDSILLVEEAANSIVDLRARWNTLMRGLIASEHVLCIGGDSNE